MRNKDYQSNRNKYTRQIFPASATPQAPCVEHWWDPRGRCVVCGDPKPVAIQMEVRRTAGLVDKEGKPADYDYPALLPSVLHVCGLEGFDPMKDDCSACRGY